VIQIKDFKDRRETVNSLIKLLRENLLSDEQKNKVYDIIKDLKKAPLQKKRFCMYYGIGPNLHENNTYKKIADFYDCTPNAIRSSVISTTTGLYRIPDRQMEILKDIVKNCDNK